MRQPSSSFSDLFYYGKQYLQEDEAVNYAIQDLFVDFWRTRRSLGQPRSVKLYLMISLRRKIHRSLRPQKRARHNWEDFPESLLPNHPSAEAVLAEHEDGFFQAERLTIGSGNCHPDSARHSCYESCSGRSWTIPYVISTPTSLR